MSERAQALEAIRARLRNLETTKRAADRAGWTPTALVYYVEDVTTLLGLVVAPAVGVSPQPERFVDPEPECPGEDCQRCSGEYCDVHITAPCDCDVAERHANDIGKPASLSPVEPTERAWCSGCGTRWTPDGQVIPGVVHLCGDCWRKVQAHLHQGTGANPEERGSMSYEIGPQPPDGDSSGAPCEKRGHLYGADGVCVFCESPKPSAPVEPTPPRQHYVEIPAGRRVVGVFSDGSYMIEHGDGQREHVYVRRAAQGYEAAAALSPAALREHPSVAPVPAVGVSPQLEADFQATADHIVSGIETKAESQIAWEICEALKEAASLSPVEPTPLSERHLPPAVVMLVSAASAASGYLERLQPDLAVRLWAGVQAVISTPDKTVEPKPLTGAELLDRFRQVEPAPPTPAPCVWTVDGWGHWHTTCGRMWTFADEGYTESRVVFCPGCGAPAVFPDQITR